MKNNKKTLIFTLLTSTSVFLTSCEGTPMTSEDFLKKLFPNPWEALFTFLAFVVLLIIVFFVAYKPVKKILNERKAYEKEKLESASKLETEAKNKLQAAESSIKESRKEAISIIDKAKEDASIQAQIIIDNAHKQIENEKQLAKDDILREIEHSQDEIHNEIVNVAIEASSKVLGRTINEQDNKELIDQLVKELQENK